MSKNKQEKIKKEIEPFDKSYWKALDEVEKFENTLEGTWKQKGPYIVNTSGKLEYGIFIGVDHQLAGVDEDGKPILKSVQLNN